MKRARNKLGVLIPDMKELDCPPQATNEGSIPIARSIHLRV